jgi:hypothetical protein
VLGYDELNKKLNFIKMKNFLFILLFSISGYCFANTNTSSTKDGQFKNFKPVNVFTTLKKIDLSILESRDSIQIENHLSNISNEVKTYVSSKYRMPSDFSIADTKDVLTFALLLHFYENKQEGNPLARLDGQAFLGCMLALVGEVTGLGGLIKDITAGTASVQTIWTVSKKIVKTYFSWFAWGWALYETVQCLREL